MKYKFTKAEQETVINFDNELDTASVYTHDSRLIKKLRELRKQYPEQFVLSTGSMGRSLIRFRNAASVSDRLTVKSVGNSSDRKQRKTDCRLWRREK